MRIGRIILMGISVTLFADGSSAEQSEPRCHSMYVSAVEFKGSTTNDKLGPPRVDPSKMSRGYTYTAPGKADPSAPQRWEVASYQFSPAFASAQQDDSIMLSVFVVNGDHHDVQLVDPDGEPIIDKATWYQGREYTSFFQVRKLGIYRLQCATHAPSMTATILVLPRERDTP